MLGTHEHESNPLAGWLWNTLGFTGVVLYKFWWVGIASVLNFIIWIHKERYSLFVSRVALITMIAAHIMFVVYWIQYNSVQPL